MENLKEITGITEDSSFTLIPHYINLWLPVFQLLKFLRNVKNEDNPQAGYPLDSQPDLKLEFKYSEKTVCHGQTKRYSHPRTDVSYVGTCFYPVLV